MRGRYQATDQILFENSFQTTRIAVDAANGHNVVIKEFNFSPDDTKAFIRETELLKRLNDPHVNPLINVYEDCNKCYFVQNLTFSCNLLEHVQNLEYYSQDDAKRYIKQILTGVAYLHAYNVYHGNLKPENLLFNAKTNTVKIADYDYHNLFPLEKLTYAPAFCSPEILTGEEITGAADVYAVGVISCLLLVGRLPHNVSIEDYIIDHVKLALERKCDLIGVLPDTALDFVRSCFLPIEKRPSVFKLLNHEFLAEKAPVIPLQSTQLNLQRFLARMKLQSGSAVSALLLIKLAQKIAGIEPKIVVPEENDGDTEEFEEFEENVTGVGGEDVVEASVGSGVE